MKIEIKTSNDSIKLLSFADEVFVKMCRDLIDYFEETESIAIEDRKSAIEFLKSYEQRYMVRLVETKTYTLEIKLNFPMLRCLYNRIIKSKFMSHVRKVAIVVAKEVFIKLMVEIILSLIHGRDREIEYLSRLSLSA